MKHRRILFLAAAGALACAAAPALAGGRPCAGDCYEAAATPPVYGSVAERVMIEPPRTIYRRIPAEFAIVPRPVTLAPEHVVRHHHPAEYQTVAETVMVSPGGRRWVMQRNHHGRLIGCWVEVPPKFATRHRMVLVRPASVTYQRVPAVTALAPQQVMVRPPSVAAETVPAVYGVRERTVLVRPGAMAWRRIGAGHEHRHRH